MSKENQNVTYKELPACIKGQIITYAMLAIGIFVFGLSTAIGMRSFKVVLFGLIVLVGFLLYCISWSIPFFRNKVLIIEGKVKEIEENDKVNKGLSGTLARELTRYTFTIDVNGNEVEVIKTGTKIKKKDANVVLYVPEDAINQRSDGTTLISKVLYVEVVK